MTLILSFFKKDPVLYLRNLANDGWRVILYWFRVEDQLDRDLYQDLDEGIRILETKRRTITDLLRLSI